MWQESILPQAPPPPGSPQACQPAASILADHEYQNTSWGTHTSPESQRCHPSVSSLHRREGCDQSARGSPKAACQDRVQASQTSVQHQEVLVPVSPATCSLQNPGTAPGLWVPSERLPGVLGGPPPIGVPGPICGLGTVCPSGSWGRASRSRQAQGRQSGTGCPPAHGCERCGNLRKSWVCGAVPRVTQAMK